jgi:hypothetical protein
MEKVSIAALADSDGVVRDREVYDCEICGPANLIGVGTGNRVVDCAIPVTVDAHTPLVWKRYRPVFVIGCTFANCTFAPDVSVFYLIPPPADRGRAASSP